MLAILLGVVAIGVSLPIGIVLALGRQSDLMIVKYLCVGFIEFIRGVPLITLAVRGLAAVEPVPAAGHQF